MFFTKERIISLFQAFILLIASTFVGAAIFSLLQIINLNNFLGGILANSASILLFSLALFSFNLKTLRSLRCKLKGSIGPSMISFIILLTISFTFSLFMKNEGNLLEDLTKVNMYTLIITTIFISPVIEEIAFRAGLKEKLINNGSWGSFGYILISSMLFAIIHLDIANVDYFQLLNVLAIGLVLSLVYLKTNNLMIPILVHSLYNLVVVIFFLV